MHVICRDCTEFQDEILLRGGECKTRENSNFLKNGKMVILVKIQNFSIIIQNGKMYYMHNECHVKQFKIILHANYHG